MEFRPDSAWAKSLSRKASREEKAYSVIKSSPLLLWAILSYNSIQKLMYDPIIN